MKFEIWSEGYKCNSENAQAYFHKKIEANSFKKACDLCFDNEDGKKYYDSKTLTYWGCKLFDNEEDARRNFG